MGVPEEGPTTTCQPRALSSLLRIRVRPVGLQSKSKHDGPSLKHTLCIDRRLHIPGACLFGSVMHQTGGAHTTLTC